MGDFEPTRRAVLPLLGLPLLAPAGAQAFEEAAGWADQRDARAALVRRELEKAVGTKLVLLGTGAGPVAGRARQMASSLIVRGAKRSEERSVGKECVSKCRSRWSQDH